MIFVKWCKLYLVMSSHLWSDMHPNHTSFVLWLFFYFNDLVFLHCNQYLWRKHSTVASEKGDSMEWLFNYHFCLSNLLLHWVIFQLLLLLQRRKSGIYNRFAILSFSFLRQYRLLEMNQLESWIYLQIEKLEFLVVFATFVHVVDFFEQPSHLHNTSKRLLSFLESDVAAVFTLVHSSLYFWYVYIFSLVITFS